MNQAFLCIDPHSKRISRYIAGKRVARYEWTNDGALTLSLVEALRTGVFNVEPQEPEAA